MPRSPALIATLLALCGCAGTQPSGDAHRAYENTPGYQHEQPFAYDEPVISDFYDSSYEESLYSPFSYN